MNTYTFFRLLNLWLTLLAFGCNTKSSEEKIFSTFNDITEPASFAPELALPGNTYKGCFSGDYTTFYFFRYKTPDAEDYRIYQSKFENNKWTPPAEISFSDSSSDLYPLISPVKKDEFFFISYRRYNADTGKKPNANFWISPLENKQWGTPREFEETDLLYNYNSQPCITANGNIYFTSDTPDWSRTLTYKIPYQNGSYQKPELFSPVNLFRQVADSSRKIFEVCVSPDETYMVLTVSDNRQPAKLFISNYINNMWSAPQYIGDLTRTDMSGNFPYITADGRFLIFTRRFSGFFILPTHAFLKTRVK